MEKKIALFIDGYVLSGEYQGSRTYVEQLIRYALDDPRFHVILGMDKENCYTFDSKNVLIVPYRHSGRLRYILDIPKYLREYDVDVVLTQYFAPIFVTQQVKRIIVVHDILPLTLKEYFPRFSRFRNFLQEFSIRIADHIVTVSEYSKNIISETIKPKAAITVTLNGLDESWDDLPDLYKCKEYIRKHYGLSEYYCVISRIEPRKNVEIALELAADGEKVVWIGSNTFNNEKIALRIRNEPNFLHITNLDKKTLKIFIRACRAFIYPSFAEGFGIPPIEAASQCVPIACSNRTALGDLKLTKESFFDPNSYESLKRCLSVILKSSQEELLMQRASVLKEYNWEASFIKLKEKIYEVINDKI